MLRILPDKRNVEKKDKNDATLRVEGLKDGC